MLPVSQILTAKDKQAGVRITALMVINAVLDFFSLAAFLPLLFLMVKPASSFPFLSKFYSTLGFTSHTTLMILFAIGVLIFIIAKNVIAHGIARAKANYCFMLGNDLSCRMLVRYTEINYLKFTTVDFTSELNRIANVPLAFANNIIMPLANLLSEGLTFLLLLIGIAWYEPRVFGLLIIVLLPIAVIYTVKRKHLTQTSQDLKRQYPLTLKYALQTVEGWADIKAFGKESFFKRKFSEASRALAKTFTSDHVSQTSASRLTEVAAGIIICALIVYSTITLQNYQQTVLLLGIYAGAGFRMIPSMNRILTALFQIRSHQYLFEELKELAHSPEAPEKETQLSFHQKIELRNISFRYDKVNILDRATLTIKKGDKIALTGKSGSGKTTVILMLMGFLKPSSGKFFLDDVEVSDEKSKALKKMFGYVPQSPYLLDGTIAENIAFGMPAREINFEKIEELIRDLDLEEMINHFPEGLSTLVGERGVKLSGGQRQRISIARALYADPQILLLDEITNQLDATTEHEVIETLEKVTRQEKTIVMVTHHDHLMSGFERVLTVQNGHIVEATNALNVT